MPKKQPTNKWNISKNVNLKKSIKSSMFESSWKSNKESKQGGS